MPAPTQPGDGVPAQAGLPAAGREVGRGAGEGCGEESALAFSEMNPSEIIHHCAPASSRQPLPERGEGLATPSDTLFYLNLAASFSASPNFCLASVTFRPSDTATSLSMALPGSFSLPLNFISPGPGDTALQR